MRRHRPFRGEARRETLQDVRAVMPRFDMLLRRHRRLVVVAWVTVLAVATPFSLRQTDQLTDGGFQTPGSDSYKANQALQHDFRGPQRNAFGIVLAARDGASAVDLAGAVDAYAAKARRVDHIQVP